MLNRASTFLYQRQRLVLFLLLGPPLIYMLVARKRETVISDESVRAEFDQLLETTHI